MAVEKGHVDTVRCLVEKGANISIQDQAGVNNATLPIGRHLSLLYSQESEKWPCFCVCNQVYPFSLRSKYTVFS